MEYEIEVRHHHRPEERGPRGGLHLERYDAVVLTVSGRDITEDEWVTVDSYLTTKEARAIAVDLLQAADQCDAEYDT